MNLLNDSRFKEFVVPAPSKTSKGTKKDKIYDVMSFQLERMEQVLNEKEIDVYSTTIQGDYLEIENSIKIDISEDTSKPYFTGKGKKKKRGTVRSIVPSAPYIQENVTKHASEILSKRFYGLFNIIRDKKIMSEILEIEETDEDALFKAFVKQYGELWLTTNERERELIDRLKERCLSVLNKYIQKNEEVGAGEF